MQNRRQFLESAAAAGLTLGAGPMGALRAADAPLFSISLAQWSLNRMLFAGELDALDFPAFAKSTFGIDAVEYVHQFFMDKARDRMWLPGPKKALEKNRVQKPP